MRKVGPNMATDTRKVREIFGEASELPRSERGAFLDRVCGQDPDLRDQVESLLSALDRNGGFLAGPTAHVPSGTCATSGTAPGTEERISEGPGTRIGPYKLLQLIGEGGFGTVFMAEQEEPVKRRVALKIIKLGMDTRQVIARFEAERQALAMMDHPNIAKVFDAGATGTGRPFFVMELVKGVPITDYCDTNNLSTRDRLELFQQVCHAVQHAHQKGIIHRDLKPGNVLVTSNDGRPMPKVIDFGIAKATSGKLTEKTVFTEFRQFIGTPEYMSPEQAEMNASDIDTRSDVYSLGVLLYQLLTGVTPFDAKKLRSAAYAEIQRIIREEEPPKPSTRVSTLGDSLPSIAARRHTEPGRLSRLLRGDLDWIVMKSLEKDRTRRYETANDLAADLGRHLTGLAVVAAPPSKVYAMRKFVRRNRGAVGAGAGMFLILVAGVASTSVGLRRALEESRRAEAARDAEREQRTQAEGARAQADEARRETERRAEELRRVLYSSSIGYAQSAYQNNRIERAKAVLAQSPEDLRGWEWRYLSYISDRSVRTLTGDQTILCGAVSRDWSRVVTGDSNGRLRLWDADPFREILSVGASKPVVQRVAFSPDGRVVASKGMDSTISLWDARTLEPISKFKPPVANLTNLVFSPDSGLLALSGWDQATVPGPAGPGALEGSQAGVVLMVSAASGAVVHRLDAGWGAVQGCAFGADGGLIAGACQDRRARLWDARTGASVREFAGHTDVVTAVALSPDGTRLATGSVDTTVKVWDTANGRELFTLRAHAGPVNALCFSPDGRRLASGSGDTTVRVWDVYAGTLRRTLKGQTGGIVFVQYSTDGAQLISAGSERGAKVWSVRSDEDALTIGASADRPVRGLAFSPDGSSLVVGLFGAEPGLLGLDPRTTENRWSIPCSGVPGNGFDFTPDGARLALFGKEGRAIEIWDPKRRVRVGDAWPMPDPALRPWCVGISPDGLRAAVGGSTRVAGGRSGGWLAIVDLASGAIVTRLPDQPGPVRSVVWSPDGRRVVSTSFGSPAALRAWDVPTGHLAWEVAPISVACDPRFSPDSAVLASPGAASESLAIRDAATGVERRTLPGHNQAVQAVAFNRDGSRLASVGWEGSLKLWDVSTGTELLSVPTELRPSELAWSPDDSRLAYATRTGGIVVLETVDVDEPTLQRRSAARTARDADELVRRLYNQLLIRGDVVAHLRADGSLADDLRTEALRMAEAAERSSAGTINQRAWPIVAARGGDPDDYARALRWAEVGVALAPGHGLVVNTLGAARYRTGNPDEALAVLRESERMNSGSEAGPQVADWAFIVLALHQLGRADEVPAAFARLADTLIAGSFDSESLALFGEAVEGATGVLFPDAAALDVQGGFRGASAVLDEFIERARAALGADHPVLAVGSHMLGRSSVGLGEYAGAERALRESDRIQRGPGSAPSAGRVVTLALLGRAINEQGRRDESVTVLRECLDLGRQALGPNDPRLGAVLDDLGLLLLAKGDLAEADPLLREALAIHHKNMAEDAQTFLTTIAALTDLLLKGAGRAEAERFLGEQVGLVLKGLGEGNPDIDLRLSLLGYGLLGRGTPDAAGLAEPLLRRALAIRERDYPDGHPFVWRRYNAQSLLGGALLAQGEGLTVSDPAGAIARFQEAEPLLVEAGEKMEPPPESSLRRREAIVRIVRLYEVWDTVEPDAGMAGKGAAWRGRLGQAPGPSWP